MKNHLLILLLSALPLLSCNKELSSIDTPPSDSTLTITIDNGTFTKAVTPTNSERAVSSLAIFVFDGSTLEVSRKASEAERTAGSVSLSVKPGSKTIYAIANLPEAKLNTALYATSLATIKAIAVDLSDNIVSGTVCPIMTAEGSTTISGATTNVALTLNRLISRVSVTSITNSLSPAYGTLTVKSIYLFNAVGSYKLSGPVASPTWYNQDAMKSGRAAAINVAADAQVASLTFKAPASSVARHNSATYGEGASATMVMYAFPNATTSAVTASRAVFAAAATGLMVVATISGTDYYYPIYLTSGLAANAASDVSLTISGLGNTGDNPYVKVDKKALNVSVAVSNWTSGASYNEPI